MNILLHRTLLATALALAAGQAMAVDTGTIAAGSGSITHNGAATQINQSSDKLIVNWNHFDIANGETVNISQPGARSAILNRVTGSQSATHIDGALNANGRVFVVNPNGVVVGQSGRITASGVVLSALNVSDQDFINGGKLTAGSANASVRNGGTISANGGDVVLIAPQVVNHAGGTISVNNGNAELQAASAAQIGAEASVIGGSYYATPAANALAANDGVIQVSNGSISLNALYSGSDAREVMRNTGTLSASAKGPSNWDEYVASKRTGNIWLDATRVESAPNGAGALTGQGAVNIGGTVSGNNVYVNASDIVNVQNGARITASYKQGGFAGYGLQGGYVGIYADTINRPGTSQVHGDAATYVQSWSEIGY